MDACRVTQSVVNQFSVSGFYIAVDLGAERNPVSDGVVFKAGFVHPNVILFSVKRCPIGVHPAEEDPLEANMFWVNPLNLSFERRNNLIEKAGSEVRTVFLTQRRELNIEIIIVGEFLCSGNITPGSRIEKDCPTII